MGAQHIEHTPAYQHAVEAARAVGCHLARDEDQVVVSCQEYQALVWLGFRKLLAYRMRHRAAGIQVAPERLADTILSEWGKVADEIADRVIQLQEESPKGQAQAMLNFHRPTLEFMAGAAFHGWALEGRPLPLAEPKKKKGGR